MGTLTILFLFLITQTVRAVMSESISEKKISLIRSTGLLALVVGIFGQLIGMYTAFGVMEGLDGISSSVLAGGLKVSLITTLYGFVIYIVGIVASMFLQRRTA